MDYTKVPTDNMWKFLAIAGLAVVVFSFVWPQKVANELTVQLDEYNRQALELNADLNQFLLGMVSHQSLAELLLDDSKPEEQADEISLDALAMNAETAEEFAALMNLARAQRSYLLMLNVSMNPEQFRKFLLMLDDNCVMSDCLNLSEEEYKAFVKGLPEEFLETSQKTAQASAPEMYRRHGKQDALMISMWELNDQLDLYEFLVWFTLGGGIALCVFGFGMWYYRLQRHQDAIVLQEALKAE